LFSDKQCYQRHSYTLPRRHDDDLHANVRRCDPWGVPCGARRLCGNTTEYQDRSRRAKDAAHLSGEVLAGVATLLRLAEEASLQGSFLDPLSSRFLSFARREIDVYDRNRELLFSLTDSVLRARLHSFVVRLSIPLDRLADDLARYKELYSTHPFSPSAAELQKEIQATFSYLMESRKMIPELLALLQPLARNKFDTYSRIDSDGILTDKSL
jgi:hypothetical protein